MAVDNVWLGAALTARGMDVIDYPCIDIRLMPPQSLPSCDALAFTSRHAVRACATLPRVPLIGAVGPATAAEIEALGRAPDIVADPPTGAVLAGAMAVRLLKGSQVLYLCGRETTSTLQSGLEKAGMKVVSLPVYENVSPDLSPIDVSGPGIVLFASPSAVARFVAVNPDAPMNLAALAIGPTTLEAVLAAGFADAHQAAKPTDAAVLAVLLEMM
ncbi:MAG: uroporphyrinogen-III synthase [Pseudomonadota bacterium]|nr:uroporphyrinogen-III synthase [Pseudomonadota bacterium]